MKMIRKTGILALGLLLLAGLGAPARAANAYTPVEGTSCSFNKYLIMDAGDNVPNVTFSFTAKPGEARTNGGAVEIRAGVGTPTVSDVAFAPADSTQTESGSYIDLARAASARAAGLTAANGVELESGEKFAVKQATVSFAGIYFNEPGIYRYLITETADAAHEAAGIMHDNDTDRVLDVYVTDNGSGTLVVSAYVLHTEAGDVVFGETADDKTDGFTNEYNSKDLVFKKEVGGNQASRSKWFEFTVTLTGVNDADVFMVSLADDNDANTTDGNASAVSGSNAATRAENRNQTNPTSLTGAELKEGVKFYLRDGQSIAIRGIAPNAGYSVTEDAEDYTSSAAAAEGFADAVSGTIGQAAGTKKAVMTSYLNEREGAIPTGVLLTVIPGVVIVGLAAAGLILLGKKKKRS